MQTPDRCWLRSTTRLRIIPSFPAHVHSLSVSLNLASVRYLSRGRLRTRVRRGVNDEKIWMRSRMKHQWIWDIVGVALIMSVISAIIGLLWCGRNQALRRQAKGLMNHEENDNGYSRLSPRAYVGLSVAIAQCGDYKASCFKWLFPIIRRLGGEERRCARRKSLR